MLALENISFSYKKAHEPVLRGVSFSAAPGEVTAIVGANAAGKSTLLKIVAGVLKASGSVRLGDRELRELPAREVTRRVGYLTQESDAKALLTVFEVVLLGRMLSLPLKVPPGELEAVWRTIREVRIDAIADRVVSELSGGQRRMASIAQTIVREPPILLLDEPTANLDMQNQLEVLELLRSYTRRRGTATVLTLHDLNLAARYADRLVMLREGALYRCGPPAEVLTAESVRETYRIEAEITHDSAGVPLIHPLRSIRLL